ncbi:DUF4303 domain-containing protein [Embleya hyalina]|uniref:DUF4303 domain-containing protein n=1 Tax=Embleya hyalina TaxID=516124 RepID=UPI000F83EC2C
MTPSKADPAEAVYRAAVSDLFREYPEHDFHCCAPVTSGEAFVPSLSAWSPQALAAAAGGPVTRPKCCGGPTRPRRSAPMASGTSPRSGACSTPERRFSTSPTTRGCRVRTAVARDGHGVGPPRRGRAGSGVCPSSPSSRFPGTRPTMLPTSA